MSSTIYVLVREDEDAPLYVAQGSMMRWPIWTANVDDAVQFTLRSRAAERLKVLNDSRVRIVPMKVT